jgi:hypothetical protein
MRASDGRWVFDERRRQLEDVLDGVLQELVPVHAPRLAHSQWRFPSAHALEAEALPPRANTEAAVAAKGTTGGSEEVVESEAAVRE